MDFEPTMVSCVTMVISIVVYKPDGVNHGRSIDSFVNMVAEDKENKFVDRYAQWIIRVA